MNKIGIIGYGNMGSAIAESIAAQYDILVFDKDKTKAVKGPEIKAAADIRGLVNKSEALILAVKPQDFEHALKELRGCLRSQLVISIAAGITTKHIEKVLGKVRVIRVMPNLAAKIRESVTCLSRGAFASEDDLIFSQDLFSYLGVTRVVEENMMNAVTAISGSGPGYVFDFIDSNQIDPLNIPEHTRHDLMKRLERAGEAVGFNREDAAFLAAGTVNASLSVLRITKIAPGELAKQVASKGGTTEAALKVLHAQGTWEEAAQAALKRAGELAK
ncbi:MAG: pyrroline-5-carboxylate reductase [Candidatus Omnitrophica bacterium]|jgi:pyrroline-5-carboxylate reductase|nr:pyrroline-5-carboxylate reductase [Candidatus Omnitrophota bacterium]MDD5078798.1 pyrroline-5-carboxylate reductase [Candidatus Omnitrophota bacterium]